jgi:hypothetical protein
VHDINQHFLAYGCAHLIDNLSGSDGRATLDSKLADFNSFGAESKEKGGRGEIPMPPC